jgi:propanol-preferring alcohol dehydrogenase
MNSMKAAVVPALGAPLEIREIPVPEPGPGQVLVRMQASGICHTDIHAARGDWPVKPHPAVRARPRGHRHRGGGR